MLDFALSRTASRDWREGDRILVSRLDHDGGVVAVGRARRRPRLRGRLGRRHSRAASRSRRSRAEARRPRPRRRVRRVVERGRDDHRRRRASRSSRIPPARSAGSTPSSTPRTSRSTYRRSAATCYSARPYKFCGPHLGLAYGRHDLLESWRPYKARPRRVGSGRTEVRARHRRRTSCSRASRRRSATSSRSAGCPRSPRTSASSGSASSTALPESVTVYGLQTMEGTRPDVPAQRRRRSGRRRRGDDRGAAATASGLTTTGTRSASARSCRIRATRCASGFIHYNTVDEIDRFNAALAQL